MKRLTILLFAVAVSTLAAQQPDPLPLLQPEHLVYSGAFRLPPGSGNTTTFDYGGRGATFNPARNSLFLAGHEWNQWLAEVEVPEVRKALSLSGLAVARLRQPFARASLEWPRVGAGAALGGLLVWNDTLIMTAYVTYDARGAQSESHFVRSSLDLQQEAEVTGPFRLAGPRAGFVAGYMTPIPPEWRDALGGLALTGQCCISIISRTSHGPAVSVFDPDDLGKVSPVPSKQLVGYPIDQPTLGRCEETSRTFNCATTMGGVVFPGGTRSVLFFGRQGLGAYCYGEGGTGHNAPCYDPTESGKGTHAYPYAYQVWAYDARDLQAVKEGRRRPWEVRPYRTWNFELPFQNASRNIRSVAYDPTTRRIFVVADRSDADRPLVHVFTLGDGAEVAPGPEVPTAPPHHGTVDAGGAAAR